MVMGAVRGRQVGGYYPSQSAGTGASPATGVSMNMGSVGGQVNVSASADSQVTGVLILLLVGVILFIRPHLGGGG